VVKVEDTEDGEGSGGVEKSVKVVKGVGPGQWVRPIGSDVAMGQVVLPQGTQVQHTHMKMMKTDNGGREKGGTKGGDKRGLLPCTQDTGGKVL
jgi:molybdopterin biosynthesis enzyme